MTILNLNKYFLWVYMKKLLTIATAMICLSIVSKGFSYEGNPCIEECVDPGIISCDAAGHGLYVGAFGGASWIDVDAKRRVLDRITFHSKVGGSGAISLGYKFNNSYRLEAEVGVLRNRINAKHFVRESKDVDFNEVGHAKAIYCTYWTMANLYYDFDLVSRYIPCVVPYWGFGLGVAKNHLRIKWRENQTHDKLKDSSEGLAYQWLAGVGYQLTDCTTLALEYRNFNSKKFSDNSVGLSIRQSF